MLCFSSCNTNQTSKQFNNQSSDTTEFKNYLQVKYAKGFEIENHSDYKIVRVFNPWQGANNIRFEYILAKANVNIPSSLRNLPLIRIPITRIICLSTTHIAAIDFISKTNTIKGISGGNYIYNPAIKNLLKEGEIKDVGYDQSLNYEMIVALKPDIVMAYGVGSNVNVYAGKLKELGIQVVMNAEYLETSPLGKAEWCKYIAAFYDIETIATEKFSQIEKEYSEIKNMTDSIRNKPTVFSGLPWNGTWYISGGQSYLARLIYDAGGNYVWKEEKSKESFPVGMETIFQKTKNAEIWINSGSANTKIDILQTDQRLGNLLAFKTGRIFNNNAIQNKEGGNDYWESGIMKPHLILKDLAAIFHPDLFPNYKLSFYKKLN
jgi:iron complex transport system substrate-binding protein